MENVAAATPLVEEEEPMGGSPVLHRRKTPAKVTAEEEILAPESSDQSPAAVEVDSSSGAYESAHQAKGLADHPMTEEDLLTGPAHNLDDSQYKSDIVDPNLDDIFK